MGFPALGGRRHRPRSRPQKGMTEAYQPGLAHDDASVFHRAKRLFGVEALCPQRAENRIDRLVAAGRNEQHRPAAISGEAREGRLVHRMEPGTRGEGIGQLGRASPLSGGQLRSNLDERQRIAVGGCDETGDDGFCGAGREHTRGICTREAMQRERVEPVERGTGGGPSASGQKGHDGVVSEPASGEQHRSGGLGIQPVKIVDEHQHGRVFGCGRQERECPGCDQVPVALARARPPADRRLQRSTLGARNLVHVVAHRTEELKQAGMVEERLGLDAPGPENPEILSGGLGGLQERCLSDPGLARNHQGSATISPSASE